MAKPETSTDQSLRLEIQASLSSSRCLLKRTREQLEEDSEEEENTPKASNVFRALDKDRDSAIRKRRLSSEGSCKSCGVNTSSLLEGESITGSPDIGSDGVSGITVASHAEILGTPQPKRRR